MASPHVAALVALVIQLHPTWTVEQIRQAIRQSATDVGAAGFDLDSGWGRINAAAAVAMTSPPPAAQITSPYNCQHVNAVTPVLGYAGSAAVSGSWTAAIAAGEPGAAFTTFASGTNSVSGSAIANLNTNVYPDGTYTLRLRYTTGSGATSEDRNVIVVDNVFISDPVESQTLTGSVYPVLGMAAGNGYANYILDYAPGCNATTGFTTIVVNSAPAPTPTSPLGSWPLPAVDGQYTLRLRANFTSPSHTSEDSKCVVVDHLAAPGWPVG